MKHERIETARGPLQIWSPSRAELGLLIYVHGFNPGRAKAKWYVDQVWAEHELAKKFKASGVEGTFVAIAGKVGRGKKTYWPILGELLGELRKLGWYFRDEPIHAMGHSGAYANIANWLVDDRLNHVTLLDGLYGKAGAYRKWALEKSQAWSFNLAVSRGTATHKNAGRLMAKVPSYHVWRNLPDTLGNLPKTPILYLPTKMPHMHWVTKSSAIATFAARVVAVEEVC